MIESNDLLFELDYYDVTKYVKWMKNKLLDSLLQINFFIKNVCAKV